MKWSKEKPTEAGYYVWRFNECVNPERNLALVKSYGALMVQFLPEGAFYGLGNVQDREWLKVM